MPPGGHGSNADGDETPPASETVQLDPFAVQADSDTSYGAVNSNSITQFNASLNSLPVSADIFDQAFMDDVGATSVEGLIQTYSVHQDPRPFYVDNWIWDLYQAHQPLMELLDPKREADEIDSYVRMYRQEGWMPTPGSRESAISIWRPLMKGCERTRSRPPSFPG